MTSLFLCGKTITAMNGDQPQRS